MTSKNLLITTEKTILISNFGIVSRLRFVICILIFSICTLLGLNNSFAQEFDTVVDSSYYPDSAVGSIPLKPGLAVLETYVKPNSNFDENSEVVYARLIPSYTYVPGKLYRTTSYGFGYNVVDESSSSGYGLVNYSVVSSTTLYQRSNNQTVKRFLIPQIQALLESQNLGTAQQRSQFIVFSSSAFNVEPVDFRSHLIQWVLVGISIFLSIPPLWWIVRRFLK